MDAKRPICPRPRCPITVDVQTVTDDAGVIWTSGVCPVHGTLWTMGDNQPLAAGGMFPPPAAPVSPRLWTFRYSWALVRDPTSAIAIADGIPPIVVQRSPITFDVVDQWAGDSARACKAVEDDLNTLLTSWRRMLGYRVMVEGGYVDAG